MISVSLGIGDRARMERQEPLNETTALGLQE